MSSRNSMSKASVASKVSKEAEENTNVLRKNELVFCFPNGDRYEGEHEIYGEPPIVFRQGRGVHDTDDFNRYEAVWDHDRISGDLHISFNNGMDYKGDVDNDGNMSGPGSYFLPDGSSIEAVWKNNEPFSDIRYKEPRGFIWRGETTADGKVLFMPGNHFWDDLVAAEKSDDASNLLGYRALSAQN